VRVVRSHNSNNFLLLLLCAAADPSSQQSKELGGLPTAARVKVLQEALQFLGKIGSGLEALVGTFYHDQFGVLKQSYDDIIDGGQEPLPKLWVSLCGPAA
jgi:hypothetical protein